VARYTGPQCRLCRREGLKLFLKGERCYSDKCAVDRRKTAPGQHGARRGKLSDYGVQLREKQKIRRVYGVLEKQFRRTMAEATQSRGKTGEVLVQRLEMRLDSVVLRLGLALSRNGARQLVRHNHVKINGRLLNIPSAIVSVGDKVTVGETARAMPAVALAQEVAKREGHSVPSWLKWDASAFTGEVLSKPQRDEVPLPVKEQLVVELYSK
jgi:small subunit ribosomal protein S4